MHSIGYIKEQVAIAARKHGVERVYLFGSYANGTAHEGSDVDLRVEYTRGKAYELPGFYVDAEDALGMVDVLTVSDGEYAPFWDRVRDEEILIYHGGEL